MDKQLLEKQQDHLRVLNEALIVAVEQAQNTLADPSSQPQQFEPEQQHQTKLADAIANAKQQLAQEVDDGTATGMRANLAEAEAVQQQLQTRWQLWQQFVQQRDQASALLDLAQKQMDQQQQLQPADQAELGYEHLLVGLIFMLMNAK